MRVVGLVALILLFPSFAYAALININTADATLLDTLPHIGPATAQKIIEYRTANGPFLVITDLQKVSGIGSGSNYADIAPLITVGSASVPDASTTTVPSTPNTSAAGGGVSTYTLPPSALVITIQGAEDAILEVPLYMSARVTTKSGATDSSAQIIWSFGDGSSATGSEVEKTYHYVGTYVITVIASNSLAKARAEATLTATRASVHLPLVTGDGITVANDSDNRLDLSGWRLMSDTGSFRIPDGMTLLPKSSALFPFTITNLPIAFDATLTYPSGVIAAHVSPLSPPGIASAVTGVADATEQLPAPVVSYKQVQKVEPIISTKASVQSHEEAVIAPVASAELAATGAALPPVVPGTRATGIFHSPWTFGLFGVMALAGGAFILL